MVIYAIYLAGLASLIGAAGIASINNHLKNEFAIGANWFLDFVGFATIGAGLMVVVGAVLIAVF